MAKSGASEKIEILKITIFLLSGYNYPPPPVENRLNYEVRTRPTFTASTTQPTTTTSSSSVYFQLGPDVLIDSTTEHHGQVTHIAEHHHPKVKSPASHYGSQKQEHHHQQQEHHHQKPASYYQQQQLPKIKLRPTTEATYEEPVTVVSTLPPLVQTLPPSAHYNSINLNHVNSLIHEDPTALIDSYGSPAAHEPLDSYGAPPVHQPEYTTGYEPPPVYAPTTTTSNVFLNHNPAASSYQEQLQFLAPAQPASPVYTTVTEVFHQAPATYQSATYHPELPSAQEYIQTTMNNNNVFLPNDDLNVPSYQNSPAPVTVVQQVPATTYQEQVPLVSTTQLSALSSGDNFVSQPVVIEQQQSSGYQLPAEQFVIHTTDAPVQHLQDVSNLPVYSRPTTSSENVFLQRAPSRSGDALTTNSYLQLLIFWSSCVFPKVVFTYYSIHGAPLTI